MNLRNGQNPDWRTFFRKYHRIAVRFAHGFTKDEEGAEDIFQEAASTVYLKVTEGHVSFDSPHQFRHYFFKTVKNKAINWRKRRNKESTVDLEKAQSVSTKGNPLEEILQRETDEEVERRIGYCLTFLKNARKKERDVILMRFFYRMSYKEMSERTKEPISTLQSREKAVLKKLRKKFGKVIGFLFFLIDSG
ncbi:MAG: sigma-70 family RNA polymerase sigma factor [Gemmatimonadota bacterium]|nr:MAG: sigma-70 family RNA polymerase sigma factor [Gemmatimonadota bacterium]